MKNVKLLLVKILVVFVTFNIAFSPFYQLAPLLTRSVYAQEDEGGGDDGGGGDEGGGDEGGGDESGGDEGGGDEGGGGEEQGGGDEQQEEASQEQDYQNYTEEVSQAEIQEPEIPQEPFDFAQGQPEPVFVSTTPEQQPPVGEPEQQIEQEQQEQVAYYDDLLTSGEQDQLTTQAREEYQEQINNEPVVDGQSQDSALSSYFESAQSAADREDQEFARERGLPDAEALGTTQNLVSVLEQGQQIPDEFWQDWSSKLGDLSDGALDLVTSQVREAQEKGEQAKAQEELAQIEEAAAQQQEKVAQALDQWSGMSALERAETLREYYNLPPGTDPEQVLSFADKAMTLGGVEFRSGPQASTVGPYGVHLNSDLSSFIITEPQTSVSEYLSVPTPDLVGIVQGAIETGKDLYELYQSMPPERAVEVYFSLSPEARDQVNAAMLNGTKEIAGAAVQMVPFVGTNILSERVNGLNSNMAQIAEALKDPNLTEEEREALKQEYFSSLNEVQDVKKDLAINAAFDLVGGIPGSALAERAAGKSSLAAKELFLDTKAALAAAKQAGKEGLEGVWVGGRQLVADERGSFGWFGLFTKEEQKTAKAVTRELLPAESMPFNVTSYELPTSVRAGDEIMPLEERYGSEQIERAQQTAEELFGAKTEYGVGEMAYLLLDKDPEKIGQHVDTAKELLSYLQETGGVIRPDAPEKLRDAWQTFRYGSLDSELPAVGRLSETTVEAAATRDANFLAGVTSALVKHEEDVAMSAKVLEETGQLISSLDEFAARNGVETASFIPVSEVVDPDRFVVLRSGSGFSTLPEYKGDKVTPAGIQTGFDGQVILDGYWSNNLGLVAHEFCHRECNMANPSYLDEIVKAFGGSENGQKVWEGFTERVTRFGEELMGKKIQESSYNPQVAMVDQIIQSMVEHSGITTEQGMAKVIEAQRGGFKNLDEIYQLGGGKEKVNGIVDRTPNTRSNVVEVPAVTTPLDIALAQEAAQRELNRLAGQTGGASYDFRKPSLGFGISEVFAQDAQSKNNLPNSRIFEMLVRKELAKRTLTENGKVNDEYLKQLLKTDVVPQEIKKTYSGLSMTTGKSGTAQTETDSGQYMINTNVSPELDIKTPSFVEVKAGTTVVPIGIREGSGKVEKMAGVRNVGGPFAVYAQDKSFDTSTSLSAQDGQGPELPKVQVAAFYDENGNGNWDGKEKALPWAGIQVSLTKVNQKKSVSMLPGWNLITLTALPTNPLTASNLLGQIAKQGGYATTVSKLENGAWKSYVIRGDNTFSGDDFPIEPGQAYFVKNLKRALLTFEGQEFAAPVKVNLQDGWNAVGFPKTAGEYTVSTLIDELNTQDAGADAASRWESGLWDSFVKKSFDSAQDKSEEYGENFPIESNRGYIVRLKKGGEFAP